MRRSAGLLSTLLVILCACAGNPAQVPYPSFVQSSDVPDTFLAGFPGTRAKVFTEDVHSRRASLMLQLPSDWNLSTGAAPDKTLEIFVLSGAITIGEFGLQEGGYAFLPSGSMGVSMTSDGGALLLYFIDVVQPGAVIQTPIISSAELMDWQVESDKIDDFGFSTKELRSDPGSGARTWLLKIDPGAMQDWQQASTVQEGFLVSGHYRHSECGSTGVVAGEYLEGGYFLRPAGAINGGPDAAAVQPSVWLMRVPNHSTVTRNMNCSVDAAN